MSRGGERGHGRGDVGLLAHGGAGADLVVLLGEGLLLRDDSPRGHCGLWIGCLDMGAIAGWGLLSGSGSAKSGSGVRH